jgi:hypothetical protein
MEIEEGRSSGAQVSQSRISGSDFEKILCTTIGGRNGGRLQLDPPQFSYSGESRKQRATGNIELHPSRTEKNGRAPDYQFGQHCREREGPRNHRNVRSLPTLRRSPYSRER